MYSVDKQHNYTRQAKTKHISDLISDQYKQWNNEFIVFDADTGTGKTYFIFNILAPYTVLQGKQILYLCNRKSLREAIQTQVMELELDNIDVMSYQKLQNQILEQIGIEQYDYIIFDEIHYLFSDSFNEYTDITCDYLMKQTENVCILMSATAKSFFTTLQAMGKVKEENKYSISKDYSYVNDVILYNASALTAWIDGILAKNPDDKIIVFCNSAKRMLEMYDIYGNEADYHCSGSSDKLRRLYNPNVIIRNSEEHITFSKSILFTTKVLDNGIDFKDRAIRHIFTEIFDVDSMVQSLGRKRPLDSNDCCTFYIKNYSKYGINNFLKMNDKQLKPVNLFKEDRDMFYQEYGGGKKRKEWREIKCFYPYVGDPSNTQDEDAPTGFRINNLMYAKLCHDEEVIYLALANGYDKAIKYWLGDELASKVVVINIDPVKNNSFIEYLEENKLKYLHKPEQETLKDEFKKAGLKRPSMGIRNLIGILGENDLPYTILSHKDKRRKLDDGTMNPYRDKVYWIIEDFIECE
ncbi:MAG: hypothetical protein FWC92_04565 [Defluviitaleaceae bacterium]|nr:hypothetical protein [Defluviitaleaceae bacterium]